MLFADLCMSVHCGVRLLASLRVYSHVRLVLRICDHISFK